MSDMGFLIAVVVAIIIAFCAAGWLAFALYKSTARRQAKAETNAQAILDDTFAGKYLVIYQVNWESLTYETVLRGARKRGYGLATPPPAKTDVCTLTFELDQ